MSNIDQKPKPLVTFENGTMKIHDKEKLIKVDRLIEELCTTITQKLNEVEMILDGEIKAGANLKFNPVN
jgi:hypothetical protein